MKTSDPAVLTLRQLLTLSLEIKPSGCAGLSCSSHLAPHALQLEGLGLNKPIWELPEATNISWFLPISEGLCVEVDVSR